MSTSYYKLKSPITSVRIISEGIHSKITIWINSANVGSLCLRKEEINSPLRLFIDYEEDNYCPMRTHWGGSDVGTIVSENHSNLRDEQQLISEYGELLTVGQVRARHGAKRKDGMPTELFGFEVNNG